MSIGLFCHIHRSLLTLDTYSYLSDVMRYAKVNRTLLPYTQVSFDTLHLLIPEVCEC